MMWVRLKRVVPYSLKRVIGRGLRNGWESARYRLTKKDFDHRIIYHVIFICKGNICRSAFAEHYLKGRIPDGILMIESCGLDVEQGIFAPPRAAVCVAKEFDIDLGMHRSRGIASCDIHRADLILPMEFRQYLRLIAMFPGKKRNVRLLSDFAPWPDRIFCNIDDPYGSGENEFRRCFRQLRSSLDGLMDYLTIAGNE
jgi:protein-tyrosine phosphatase